jgi:hypothetical protein
VTTGAVGAVLGGGLVFALLSAAHLRRDLSPAPNQPAQSSPASSQPATAPVHADDAITALAEHKKETARDLRDLLEAQEVVWRFFAAPTAEDAMPWVVAKAAPPLPARGLQSPLAAVTLRHKHRLAPDGGLTSQWTVATTRFGELVVDVNDATGKPRVVWDTLALQLGASTTAPERHTAATP